MIRYFLPGAAALMLVSGYVLAQDVVSSGPGGLTAQQVDGKRLLDANGQLIGRIESATPMLATVLTPDGRHITVAMARLALGNGPRTVIEEGSGDADKLNAAEADRLK